MFDLLKLKWTAGRMSNDDRARQFWILQRYTSYTAWKRCRDAFAVFAALMERQCREEPIGRIDSALLEKEKKEYLNLITSGALDAFDVTQIENWDSYRTEWTHAMYADVLRVLSLYDKGLAHLKQGDRSVFRHTGQGVLEDAAGAARHHYQAYCLGGPRGDRSLIFYGKYVIAMKAALQWGAAEVGFAADGLEPAMADLSAPEIWEDPREIYDPQEKRKVLVQGCSDRWKQQTAHLKSVPQTPNPIEDVFVTSGQACPAYGIYEAQVRDGLMVYMCQGQQAYRYGAPVGMPGGGSRITWRLLWEDQRYVDGTVPSEESQYFPGDLVFGRGPRLMDEPAYKPARTT